MQKETERESERGIRELAMEISFPSFGSSQTLPRPHLRMLAASRFWSFNDTISAPSLFHSPLCESVEAARNSEKAERDGVYTPAPITQLGFGIGGSALCWIGLCLPLLFQ